VVGAAVGVAVRVGVALGVVVGREVAVGDALGDALGDAVGVVTGDATVAMLVRPFPPLAVLEVVTVFFVAHRLLSVTSMPYPGAPERVNRLPLKVLPQP
jgi:hypothetical protein